MSHGKRDRNAAKSWRAVLIAGPTASGKSALALTLAEKFGGAIINADSMQVYRDLRIITARPTEKEEARVPHRLYGHVDAAERYSVGRWLTDMEAALSWAESEGRLPILVGGTGLYFKVATEGLATVPPIPAALREGLRARLQGEGVDALHSELARRDPRSAARIRPADRTRVLRALEVVEATGRSLLDWQADGGRPVLDPEGVFRVFLSAERAELVRRIDRRFDAMVAAGALEEARALATRNLDPQLPAMTAHGMPWLLRHLRGEMELAEASERAKRDTRRYAKRQLTWFRHQLPDWPWLVPDEAEKTLLAALSGGRPETACSTEDFA